MIAVGRDFSGVHVLHIMAMNEHREAVEAIAAQVRGFYARKEPFRIYHGSTNSTRPLSFPKKSIINTSGLSKVIRVDTLKNTVLVEPNVSMYQLVDATLKCDLVPKVVMEFPGITVGGGFAGTSGESSSFKHGFFEDTVSRIEIVLANGDVVNASPTLNSDLFQGAAGTFGTLGVMTLLEVELVPAGKYVELTFIPVSSVSDAVKELQKATEKGKHDYVDGIVFGPRRAVVMTGRMTDTLMVTHDIVRFTRSADPWFYLYAEERIDQNPLSTFTIAVPLRDYLFRYDRGAFWVGKYAFKYFRTPFNNFTRFWLDPFMRTKVMYHALHESGLGDKYIVQDIRFPQPTVGQFIHYLDQKFGFYPLWLCPLRNGRVHPFRARTRSARGAGSFHNETAVNVGLWGPGPNTRAAFVAANLDIEQKTRELHGLKWLYARTYYTEEEFWDIYDREWYDALRSKFHANTLPTVYDKVKFDPTRTTAAVAGGVWKYWPLDQLPRFWDIWPLAGLYGVFKAAVGLYSPFGKDYILATT